MSTSTTQHAANVLVEVSQDRLQAFLTVPDAERFAKLTEMQVRQALAQARIPVDEEVIKRLRKFLELVAAGGEPPERFLIAEGKPPVEARDAEFVWDERFRRAAEEWQSDSQINYYKLSRLAMVKSGEVIGEIKPAVYGQDGVDVYGKPIPSKQVPKEIELGDTVQRSEDDPNLVVAKVSGRVDFTGGRLSVVELVEIPGDVNFESGSIDAPVDVQVGGTIRSGFEVKSAGSITVGGAIESAVVEAAGDVTVRGGIVASQEGHVRAGGEIVAKFCNEADLRAEGNISILKEVIGSRIHTRGRFLCEQGSVMGGRVYAREGAEVGSLGSEAGVTTVLIVGPDPEVLAEAARIERNVVAQKESATKIRETVLPLLNNQKRLTPEQKERATELLFQADTMESNINNLTERREKMLAETQPSKEPTARITKIVYPGAAIQFGLRQTVFHEPLRGPVRVERRKVENVTELVLVNELSGSSTILPSQELSEDRAGSGAAEGEG